MTGAELVGLLALLGVFVFAPMLLMLCCSNRAQGPKPSLRECPHCGAEYRGTPTRCYACEHQLILPVSPAEPPAIIQRVRQTDTNKARQATEPTRTPPATKAA